MSTRSVRFAPPLFALALAAVPCAPALAQQDGGDEDVVGPMLEEARKTYRVDPPEPERPADCPEAVGNEILVGKTELSYTYTQAPREGRPYNLYHGTLEARPVTATTSRLVYTLVFDNSMLADDAARDADRARRLGAFTRALENMKTLAEGGTLPPRAPR